MPTKGSRRRAENQAILTRAQPILTPEPKQPLQPLAPEPQPGSYRHWQLNRPHRYWLVQRLEPGNGWFSGKFDLEYMGASEFEWGAPHRCVQSMRDAGDFQIMAETITWHGQDRTVYFIASCNGEGRDHFERKVSDFKAWLDGGLYSMEYTHFEEVFTGNYGWSKPEWVTTVAWWSLDAEILWTFDPEVAEALLYGLEHPAV